MLSRVSEISRDALRNDQVKRQQLVVSTAAQRGGFKPRRDVNQNHNFQNTLCLGSWYPELTGLGPEIFFGTICKIRADAARSARLPTAVYSSKGW